jgi:diguanylate cyclase (GGDEF)-like protein/PAS domain S-box-containing protein
MWKAKMDLTKQKFVRGVLLSMFIIFAAMLLSVILTYLGYLHIGAVTYTPTQIGILALVALIPVVTLVAYRRESSTVAGVAILALNFVFPLFMVDEMFRYSMPQVIWMPFALALAICTIRWAILTFITTLTVLSSFFPVSETQYPLTTAAVTAVIFTVLILGKLLQENLTEKARAAEKAARKSEAALRENEERYRSVFQHTIDAISIARISDGTYLEANEAFFKMTGYDPAEIIGLHDGVKIVWEDLAQFDEMQTLLVTHGKAKGFEARLKRKNGELIWGLVSSNVIDIDGVACRIAVTSDITERKKTDERIHHLAYFDALTKLPNRAQLMGLLQQVMAAQEQDGTLGAILLIDLDDFKALNDTRGYNLGDLFLQQVAERLLDVIGQKYSVARIGGDEFVILLTELGKDEQAAATKTKNIAETVLTALNREFQLAADTYRTTASIGASLFNGSAVSAEMLLKQTELAMYRAKRAGTNLIQLFEPAMEAEILLRTALKNDLHAAVQGRMFALYYQAQVEGTQLVGAEALLRWPHPLKGTISPSEFIPLAEETGLIVPLGLWVLESACRQLVVWSQTPELQHLTIAVNVSVQQFNHPDFVKQVCDVLKNTGVNPKRLKLELTESLLASDIDAIISKMNTLKEKGIRFSLDDFGTGYSSLSYLKRLPINQLKIDQAFVRDLLKNDEDILIAKTIIDLSRNMGLEVIAEGVETSAHRAFLAEMGCNIYQGYLYGRPLPIDEFEQSPEFLNLRAQNPQ